MTASTPAVSDERFRMLVEAIEDYAIYILDPRGHVTTWNIGAERNKGYKAHEIIGEHFRRFFRPEDIAAGIPEEALAKATRLGHLSAEGWRVRKDGSLFWASVVINAMRDETGSLVGFAKITRDLTERKASEERFRLLVEAVEDYAIYMLDPQGYVTTWNTGAERNKGYKAHAIIGKHFSCFFRPEDAAGYARGGAGRSDAHGPCVAEGLRVRKDGWLFWASVVINAIRDDRSQLIGFAKVTRDLTERKASEERFRLLVESVEDYAIYMLDPQGYVTTWNKGAERNKGYKAREIIGKHYACFVVPADAAAGHPAHALACA